MSGIDSAPAASYAVTVLTFIAFGFVIGILPVFFFIEIFHWIKKEQKVKHPLLKCIIISLLIGISVVVLLVGSASGESGLIALAIFPNIIFGFALVGVIIGLIYKYRGKPFIIRKL
ncbi:MAG: hypothetical protein HGA74_17015 [Deltaproteobacteria bacterium]|nr:hypothetical protein [Deltaproteobacteria bacterium]